MATQFAYAGDHVIVVRDNDDELKPQTVVKINDDGRTEIINVITGDEVTVLIKDLNGHIISSFSLIAEEDGGYPVTIPSLTLGWCAEIWVNNQLVYTFYE